MVTECERTMAERSHPPTALKLAERTIRQDTLFGPGQHVLCAVSGGPDSSALLDVLALLRKRIGHTLAAAGVDHGLREEADDELMLVAAQCEALGVAFHRIDVSVDVGSNLQERARLARHAALQRCATRTQADVIALGHTADDRAETLLLRMLRGAGPRGLSAMPSASSGIEGDVRLVRPLIRARRGDVMRHLQRHNVPFAEDPSNADRRFMRVRVRHELLPLLESLSPAVVTHLCSLADMLSTEDDPLAGLGRAQRQELERTLRQGVGGSLRAITLRLKGDRELLVQFRKRKSVEE